ncbi:hypothetical protein B194_2642 [Serratia plymuthica A30]|nr:hypothetical protein B194_2642 [Serratia plymuthica A30]
MDAKTSLFEAGMMFVRKFNQYQKMAFHRKCSGGKKGYRQNTATVPGP